MLKIENTNISGWEAAVRGMRNPMNSWEKSDSHHDGFASFVIGDNDLKLMKNLAEAGDDHGKVLRFINVTLDVVAPLYWWKEFSTYRIGTVENSCSTMHKIAEKPFEIDDFSHDRLIDLDSNVVYNPFVGLNIIIRGLNFWRERFNESDDARKLYFKCNDYNVIPTKKECWYQMIQLLPTSYNQRRTVQLNYQVLRHIYHARKNHKLDEWHVFCDWIESLPYAEELICGKRGAEN